VSDLLDLAVRVATDAGALLLERFAEPARNVGSKSSGTDMVSDADRDAEALIVKQLLKARPDDAILGEERGERAGASGIRWIVDPLDGTTNFLYGQPHWCVSIACEDEKGSVVGVVRDAVRDETFGAERGAGAHVNGTPIHVSDCNEVSTALVATGFGY
jgi:myo-inositol-1(or 4)-monophosphatase